MLLKKIKEELERLELPEFVKWTLLLVSFLMVFDVVLAILGATYLSETIDFFKSEVPVVLSNLIFLEGALIFLVGAFLEFSRSSQKTTPSNQLPDEQVTKRKRLLEIILRPGAFMMLVGVVFIGLSVIIGALFA